MPADETAAVKNRRRVSGAVLPRVMTAIGPPPSNQRGESCPRRLTEARRFHDGRVNHQSVIGSPSRDAESLPPTLPCHLRVIDSSYSTTDDNIGSFHMRILRHCHCSTFGEHRHRPATRPPRRNGGETPEGISIIRPVCGVENFSEETLLSGFHLDYPRYELLFCAAQSGDPVVPLLRRLIELHPHVPARLLIGNECISA